LLYFNDTRYPSYHIYTHSLHDALPISEAYQMATYNVARHFNLEEQIGSITPGRIAHINILKAKDNPHPVGVLAKGKWILREEKRSEEHTSELQSRFELVCCHQPDKRT